MTSPKFSSFAKKKFNSDKVVFVAHPCVAIIIFLYFNLRPWIMILFILFFMIAVFGHNFDISSDKDFTSSYSAERSTKTYFSSCNLTSFFFDNIVSQCVPSFFGYLGILNLLHEVIFNSYSKIIHGLFNFNLSHCCSWGITGWCSV